MTNKAEEVWSCWYWYWSGTWYCSRYWRVGNNTNKNFTNIISENKQNDEVIYEKIYYNASEEIDSVMEDTTENTESQLDNEGLDNVAFNSPEKLN